MANEIYSKSWWGSGVCFNTVGWGLVYKPYAQCGAVPALLLALETRATYYENETCTIATLDEIEAIAYTAPPVPTGLLADYTGASAAYSLRNLISTTTNVVRVRRSNDQAEQDFTAAEITDGTLTTWTGANDGFITTWYDQSGNALDLSTSNASGQPKIVSLGVVNIDNGLPFMQYQGTEQAASFVALSATSTGLNNFSGSVFTTYNSSDSIGCLLNGGSWSAYIGMIDSAAVGTTPNYSVGTPSYYKNSTLIPNADRADLYTEYSTNSDVLATILGCDFSTTTLWDSSISPYVYWGSNRTGASKVREFIVYNSDQTLNKSGIETNINNYYTIY